MEDILDVITSRRSIKKFKDDMVDEELIDTLIAISVVAKRLAAKLRQTKANTSESEEHENE